MAASPKPKAKEKADTHGEPAVAAKHKPQVERVMTDRDAIRATASELKAAGRQRPTPETFPHLFDIFGNPL